MHKIMVMAVLDGKTLAARIFSSSFPSADCLLPILSLTRSWILMSRRRVDMDTGNEPLEAPKLYLGRGLKRMMGGVCLMNTRHFHVLGISIC